MKWNTTKEEMLIIDKIVKRAWGTAKQAYKDIQSLEMDIIATHLNGCPLKLSEFLSADDSNFYHDIFGIASHLNRDTGELKDCFLPRFAKPS